MYLSPNLLGGFSWLDNYHKGEELFQNLKVKFFQNMTPCDFTDRVKFFRRLIVLSFERML
jgi:hypothetical protein